MTDVKELAKKDKRFQEGFFKRSFNWLAVSLLKAISYLPFWILYLLSDFAYLIIRYVLGYRKQVIVTNLEKSFPEKSKEEINCLVNKYYRHFCDMFLETIKAYSMTSKQFDKRIKFKDVEKFEEYYKQGRSPIFLGMHHNNWEWNCSVQRKGKHELVIVYNPIRGNKAFDDFMLKVRGRWGSRMVPVHKSARVTVNFNKADKPTALVLIADQTPRPTTKYWVNFLNQETPFFSGPEKIAHRSNEPIYLVHISKVKRGHYEASYHKLFDKPAEVDEKEILMSYVRKIEDIIKEEPEYYLWSHRRWKHKRTENVPLIK